MDLTKLPDQILLVNTEKLAQQERELLTKVLRHLREIERRRLFAALGFKSLFDYAVKKLGYSETQAVRRISAMRLLKEMPEFEDKIEAGTLTLTNLCLAQNLFRKQPISLTDRKHIVGKLEGQSMRSAEKIIISHAADPVELKPDRVRRVSEEKVEIRFLADDGLALKLEQVRGLLAHMGVGDGMANLIDKLCEIAIQKHNPLPPIKNAAPLPAAPKRRRVRKNFVRKSIPLQLRRHVWARASNKCQNCGSNYALQIDHIVPKAKGGDDALENLRLLCRSCNQRAAIEHIGLHKMDRYLNSPLK